jgi:hypothetical protein
VNTHGGTRRRATELLQRASVPRMRIAVPGADNSAPRTGSLPAKIHSGDERAYSRAVGPHGSRIPGLRLCRYYPARLRSGADRPVGRSGSRVDASSSRPRLVAPTGNIE